MLVNTFIFLCIFYLLQSEILKELSRRQLEAEQLKQQMLQQEIAFNIKQTEALTR